MFSILRKYLRRGVLASVAVGTIAASMTIVAPPAFADASGAQCQLRLMSINIKEAVLAMKAARYCQDFDLPYTMDDVAARIEDLRCGPQSSAMIDDLMENYEVQYKLIMKTDARMTICKQATTIHF